jgi:hypothetical protein
MELVADRFQDGAQREPVVKVKDVYKEEECERGPGFGSHVPVMLTRKRLADRYVARALLPRRRCGNGLRPALLLHLVKVAHYLRLFLSGVPDSDLLAHDATPEEGDRTRNRC